MVPFLGTEFIPRMDEGYLTPQVIRLPSVSVSQSVEIERQAQQVMMQFPEVTAVVSKIGAAEIATDPMGPNISDPIVVLKPRSEWKTVRTTEELVEKMRTELAKIPGIGINLTQPIALRVDELISGVKSQVAVKIFGDDMEILLRQAEDAGRLLKGIKGVTDLRVEQVAGQPYLNVKIDRRKIARYGINVADIQEVIETAVGGKVATEIREGQLRVGVQVRFPEERRNSVQTIGNILVEASGGRRIPLADLATITEEEGPVQISRDDARRRIVVEFNVEGRDIGGLVDEAQSLLSARLGLPPGYYLTWGGAFENQERAMRRLMVIVPVTIAVIFLLLFLTFNSVRYAALIIINLPLALIGGILGLLVTGLYLSVPRGGAKRRGPGFPNQPASAGGLAFGGSGARGLQPTPPAGLNDRPGGHPGAGPSPLRQWAGIGSAAASGGGSGERLVHFDLAYFGNPAGALSHFCRTPAGVLGDNP
jgi:cobalt-zinc-cadmium resistance protein CzcA